MLNDSKQVIRKRQRNVERCEIEKEAISWAVAQVDPIKIDEINILNASFLAMHKAVDQLKTIPTSLLIDGNRFKPYKNIQHSCIIKGDGKYMAIAAASILAKTYRDDFMENLALKFPHYSWQKNKGYPTKAHRLAIQQFGPCKHHRKSFRLLPDAVQKELF